MLPNYLLLLVRFTRSLLKGRNEFQPVAYLHITPSGDKWQVIVTRLPDEAVLAA